MLFFPPGNLAAGLASGLHVMLYVIGLAMILSNRYFSTKVCLELATISTIFVQATFTLFGSYKHYAIANADTLPAAVMVRTSPARGSTITRTVFRTAFRTAL